MKAKKKKNQKKSPPLPLALTARATIFHWGDACVFRVFFIVGVCLRTVVYVHVCMFSCVGVYLWALFAAEEKNSLPYFFAQR